MTRTLRLMEASPSVLLRNLEKQNVTNDIQSIYIAYTSEQWFTPDVEHRRLFAVSDLRLRTLTLNFDPGPSTGQGLPKWRQQSMKHQTQPTKQLSNIS